MPHDGLVRRDESTGQHESGHAAILHDHLGGAAVADALEAHAVAAELGLQVVRVDW